MTADCVNSVYATDMLVCDDAKLKVLDDRLKLVLAATPVPESDGHLAEDQAGWFRRSRLCAFQADQRDCVVAAYGERLTVVTLVGSQRKTSGQCRLTDGTPAGFGEIIGGAVLMRDGRVIAVGLSSNSAWQPFVRNTRDKRKADFRGLDNRSLAKCRFDDRGKSQ